MLPALATAARRTPANLFGDVLPWLVTLLVLVVIGGIVIAVARRYTREDAGSDVGFTLHDLRQLHAAGELSDEEYERAKSRMIGDVTRKVREDPGSENTGDAPPDNPTTEPDQV